MNATYAKMLASMFCQREAWCDILYTKPMHRFWYTRQNVRINILSEGTMCAVHATLSMSMNSELRNGARMRHTPKYTQISRQNMSIIYTPKLGFLLEESMCAFMEQKWSQNATYTNMYAHHSHNN